MSKPRCWKCSGDDIPFHQSYCPFAVPHSSAALPGDRERAQAEIDRWADEYGIVMGTRVGAMLVDALGAFAAEVRADEREYCASVLDDYIGDSEECAKLLRALGSAGSDKEDGK